MVQLSGVLKKLSSELPYELPIPLLGIYLDTYTHVYGSIIYKSQKQNYLACSSIQGRVDKQIW